MRSQRTEILLYFLGFVDLFAVAILIPQIAINNRNKGYTALHIGLASSLYGSIQTLTAPVLGGFSDIHGRKRCISLTFIMSGAVYFMFGFIENVYMFLMARAMLGIFKHSNTMCKSYLCDILPKSERASFMGKFNAISSSGFILGPLIGGYLANFELSCILVSIIFVVSGIVAEILLDDRKPVLQQKEEPSFLVLCKSLRWSRLWHLMLGRLLCALAVNSYRSDLGSRLLVSYDIDAKGLGFIISLMGIVSALSGLLIGPLIKFSKGGSGLVLNVSCLVLTLSTLLLYTAGTINQLIFYLMIFGAASSFIRVLGVDVLLTQGTGEDVGILQGLSQSIASISRGLGPVLSGLAGEFHEKGATICAAGFALVGSLAFLVTSKKPHRH